MKLPNIDKEATKLQISNHFKLFQIPNSSNLIYSLNKLIIISVIPTGAT